MIELEMQPGNIIDDNDFNNRQAAIYVDGPALAVVSGKTGCGKTEFLRTLKAKGRQVMDLEALAHHRGSVFGASGEDQPSVERFLVDMSKTWLSFNPVLPVWIEDKGAVLGKLRVPEKLYKKMASSVFFELDMPFEKRLQHIKEEYAQMDKNMFAGYIKKLERRMGFSANHKALHFHKTDQVDKCLSLLLAYYDRAYDHIKKTSPARTKLTIEFDACSDEAYILQLEAIVSSAI